MNGEIEADPAHREGQHISRRRALVRGGTGFVAGLAGCSTGTRTSHSWDFEAVAGPFRFTEGPVWDGDGVLFSDIPNSRIVRYDTETDECTIYREDTNRANGLKMNDADDLRYYESQRPPCVTR